MLYLRLKDRTNSLGALIGGVLFNNATVVKCEEGKLPLRARQMLRNNVLEKADEAAYKEFLKLEEVAKENAKASQLRAKKAKATVLAAKGLAPKEEPKAVAKKEVEEEEVKEEEVKEEQEKAAPKRTPRTKK